MSEFSIQGFTKLLELKGYTELLQFYSPSFDFVERAEAGLWRVRDNFSGQTEPNAFSISAYPVWTTEHAPYVSSYFSCVFEGDKFSIGSLSLGYHSGLPNGELHSQTLEQPTMLDIPDKGELKEKLRKVADMEDRETVKKGRRIKL